MQNPSERNGFKWPAGRQLVKFLGLRPHFFQKLQLARNILFLFGQDRAGLALHTRPKHEDVIE